MKREREKREINEKMNRIWLRVRYRSYILNIQGKFEETVNEIEINAEFTFQTFSVETF